MTWTKLSDDFPVECRDLSDAAFRTHVEALIWTMLREGNDVVSARDIRRFAESPDSAEAVNELVRGGFWEQLDDGFRVMHHREHQPTPEEIAARRAKDAKRQERRRRHLSGDHSMCKPEWCPALKSQGESQSESQSESRPSRPDPSRPVGREGEGVDRSGAGAPSGHPEDDVVARLGRPIHDWTGECCPLPEDHLIHRGAA